MIGIAISRKPTKRHLVLPVTEQQAGRIKALGLPLDGAGVVEHLLLRAEGTQPGIMFTNVSTDPQNAGDVLARAAKAARYTRLS